jgi:hypothetical protein
MIPTVFLKFSITPICMAYTKTLSAKSEKVSAKTEKFLGNFRASMQKILGILFPTIIISVVAHLVVP